MWRRERQARADAPPASAATPAQTATPALGDRAAMEAAVLALAASDDPRPIFVAAYGLDRFDRLRAAFGYDCTAELAGAVARRIGEAEDDWRCARVSDDVISVGFQARDEAGAIDRVEAVRQLAEGPYAVGGHVIDVRLRAGFSAAGPPRARVREADAALDAARADCRTFSLFDPAAHAAMADALSLMPELRNAIAWGQLSLVHQPKIDLRTGAVAGVETLVRWTHPERGPIAPSVFVPMAEETGDVVELTRWVLEHALAEQDRLAADGHRLVFAVNLSGRLLGAPAFIDWVIRRIGRDAGRLQLEITETSVIGNPRQAFDNVRRLAAAGIGCSIDDYGAGLTSLAYLKQIEATELKLDKSLVDEATRSRRDMLVTRATVDLAHSLGMKVVAEGIETAETAAALAAMGCDIGQGYRFSRPLPLPALTEFLGRTAAARAPAESKPPPILPFGRPATAA